MANQERPRDRGSRIAREQLFRMAHEARGARTQLGMSQREVADSVRIDPSWVSRLERGKAENVSVATMSRILAVLGLRLSLRAYPDDEEVRDEAHARLLARFLKRLPESVGRALEVPFPTHGDRRAWDLRLRIEAEAWGVEAESHLRDFQATLRKAKIKARDGEVDGLILLLADTRHHRALIEEHVSLIRAEFPVDGRVALERLAAGRSPGGNAVIML
ncbi:MAG: helix-turn-helix transcriptional regulator [Chloroflexota bacterium]